MTGRLRPVPSSNNNDQQYRRNRIPVDSGYLHFFMIRRNDIISPLKTMTDFITANPFFRLLIVRETALPPFDPKAGRKDGQSQNKPKKVRGDIDHNLPRRYGETNVKVSDYGYPIAERNEIVDKPLPGLEDVREKEQDTLNDHQDLGDLFLLEGNATEHQPDAIHADDRGQDDDKRQEQEPQVPERDRKEEPREYQEEKDEDIRKNHLEQYPHKVEERIGEITLHLDLKDPPPGVRPDRRGAVPQANDRKLPENISQKNQELCGVRADTIGTLQLTCRGESHHGKKQDDIQQELRYQIRLIAEHFLQGHPYLPFDHVPVFVHHGASLS